MVGTEFNSILKYVVVIVIGVGIFKYMNNPKGTSDYDQQQFEQIEEGEVSLFSKKDYDISPNHDQKIARDYPKKIKVPISNGHEFISVTDIIYCESIGKNVKIITENKSIIATRIALNDIRHKIGNAPFMYHELKSYIVNFEYVVRIKSDPNNNYSTSIILNNEEIISLPKAKKIDFTEDIGNYWVIQD